MMVLDRLRGQASASAGAARTQADAIWDLANDSSFSEEIRFALTTDGAVDDNRPEHDGWRRQLDPELPSDPESWHDDG